MIRWAVEFETACYQYEQETYQSMQRLLSRTTMVAALLQCSISIYTDSQIVLKFYHCNHSTSKVAIRSRENFKKANDHFWIPGHIGLPGNYETDELARKGNVPTTVNIANDAGQPISYLLRSIITSETKSK